MKITLDKYYDQLKEKGHHKFYFSPLDKYKSTFWIILVVTAIGLLWNADILKALGSSEKVLAGLILFGMYKLGTVVGHKDGFIDGYHEGIDAESNTKK